MLRPDYIFQIVSDYFHSEFNNFFPVLLNIPEGNSNVGWDALYFSHLISIRFL